MNVMSRKLEKDLRNSVKNRPPETCDSANRIRRWRRHRSRWRPSAACKRRSWLEQLPEQAYRKTAGAVRWRLEYPELSLSELAAEFDPPVSKSCPESPGCGSWQEIYPRGPSLNKTNFTKDKRGTSLWSGVNKRLVTTEKRLSHSCQEAFWRLFQDVIGLTETQCLNLGRRLRCGAQAPASYAAL